MSTFGRRTFLASSTGIAAGAAVAGALPALAAPADGEDAERSLGSAAAASAGPGGALRAVRAHGERSRRPRRRRPRRLLVRLDPAGVGPRRGADGLPHRGPPDRPGPARARLGQRHRAVRSPGLRRLRGAAPRRRRGVRVDGAGRVVPASAGARSRPRPGSPRRCGRPTGRPSGCSPPALPSNPTASPTCAPRSRRRQAPSAVPRPTSPRPTRTGCTSTGRRWTPGPASRTPTSSTRVPST